MAIQNFWAICCHGLRGNLVFSALLVHWKPLPSILAEAYSPESEVPVRVTVPQWVFIVSHIRQLLEAVYTSELLASLVNICSSKSYYISSIHWCLCGECNSAYWIDLHSTSFVTIEEPWRKLLMVPKLWFLHVKYYLQGMTWHCKHDLIANGWLALGLHKIGPLYKPSWMWGSSHILTTQNQGLGNSRTWDRNSHCLQLSTKWRAQLFHTYSFKPVATQDCPT